MNQLWANHKRCPQEGKGFNISGRSGRKYRWMWTSSFNGQCPRLERSPREASGIDVKKKWLEHCSEVRLELIPKTYRVEGEVGRFEFLMYDAVDVRAIEEEVIRHHRDLFPRLPGKKWYRTRGFKELAYVHGTTAQSYRKTSRWLNRVRHQPGATSARTLQDSTEAEGERLREHIYQKADGILQEQEVSSQGKPLNQETNQRFEESLCLKPEEVESAFCYTTIYSRAN